MASVKASCSGTETLDRPRIKNRAYADAAYAFNGTDGEEVTALLFTGCPAPIVSGIKTASAGDACAGRTAGRQRKQRQQ
jgi:hypothetical protein